MSSPAGDDRSRDRQRPTCQQNRAVRRTSAPRQLITFVDSQDPNSRSTIQRHTAHHSNAQRRDARIASLRNTSRPRILSWTRRQSAEDLPVTSPASSNSSSSISPLPPSQRSLPSEAETEPVTQSTPEMQPRQIREQSYPEKESIIQYLQEYLCNHSPHRLACEQIIAFARTDEACSGLLLAYGLSLRKGNGASINPDLDGTTARYYLNQGTNLLITRLSDPASSDCNIQAVLLLIAYTADFGSFQQVGLHADGLKTLIDERGGTCTPNYPSILALQLRTIQTSRYFHLTLDCIQSCEARLRFPTGLPSAKAGTTTEGDAPAVWKAFVTSARPTP